MNKKAKEATQSLIASGLVNPKDEASVIEVLNRHYPAPVVVRPASKIEQRGSKVVVKSGDDIIAEQG